MRSRTTTERDSPTPRPATERQARTYRAAAVLPAAGQARRFGSGANKIFAELVGRTVLERSVDTFEASALIDYIVVVANADEVGQVTRLLENRPKCLNVVIGGATRSESVLRGLEALPKDVDIVLVHDAARPLISDRLIADVIEAVVRTGAAAPGTSLSDTVKRVGADGIVRETIPRSKSVNGTEITGLTAVQTPQGAWLTLLLESYRRFGSDPSITDEASALEKYGAPVEIVPGDVDNVKITRAEDIALAERLLGVVAETRTGFGYDVHAFADRFAGRKLFLGGVEIPHDRGLDGHSDADVLLHAVCDALLGAAGIGDIGILFPNTDPAYLGISSLRLLDEVVQRVRAAGWKVVNVDATVAAEAPKLSPHREAIVAAISRSLGVSPDRVSVKATTSEGLGFVGRSEGVACWSVATLSR